MKKPLSFHSFSLPFTPRYSLIILSLFTFCFSLSQAQTYVGTMKMGKEVQKDVWVKYEVNQDSTGTCNVMIYRVLKDVVKPYKIDLLIPGIDVKPSTQRTTLVCYNIVPQCEGKDVPEYLVEKLQGSVMFNVLSFSCTIDGKQYVYRGVVNRRAE